jgi:hypothetical protein
MRAPQRFRRFSNSGTYRIAQPKIVVWTWSVHAQLSPRRAAEL